MSDMADVLRVHWSASTHTDSKPSVDKCDGCGAVIYTWGGATGGSEALAAHQAAALSAAGFGPLTAVQIARRDRPESMEAARAKVRDERKAALREQLRNARAEAWDEGYGAGWNDCLLDLQNGGAKMSRNPYRQDT